MIRTQRTYVVVNAIGLVAMLGSLLSFFMAPPSNASWGWLGFAGALIAVVFFAYNIFAALTGRWSPRTSAFGMRERTLLTAKIGVLAVFALAAIAIIVVRLR